MLQWIPWSVRFVCAYDTHVDIGRRRRPRAACSTYQAAGVPEHRRRSRYGPRDEMTDTPPGRARARSTPIRQQRALPDRENECTPGREVRTVRAAGAVPRRDARPDSRPRHVRPSVQCSMHLDSRPRNRRRRRRRRTHYVETTKPMAGPVRAVRACVCTAAPVLTHHQLERVSWRANDRARSSVATHLLVRVICAKSPIPRCHHATTAACMLARCWSTLIMRSRGGPRYADFGHVIDVDACTGFITSSDILAIFSDPSVLA
jgi:hypothetical protein